MPNACASSGAMGRSTSTAVSTATAVMVERDSSGTVTVSCVCGKVCVYVMLVCVYGCTAVSIVEQDSSGTVTVSCENYNMCERERVFISVCVWVYSSQHCHSGDRHTEHTLLVTHTHTRTRTP